MRSEPSGGAVSKQSVRYESNSISHEPFGSLSTVGPSTHGREIASGKKAPEVDVSGTHGPNGDADLAMRRTREHECIRVQCLAIRLFKWRGVRVAA